jgi:hypothetical protein
MTGGEAIMVEAVEELAELEQTRPPASEKREREPKLCGFCAVFVKRR